MMTLAIDKVYPLWRFSLVEKTEQDAEEKGKKGRVEDRLTLPSLIKPCIRFFRTRLSDVLHA